MTTDPLTPQDARHLAELVRRASREELLPRFATVSREHKSDGSIVTVADQAMQERLERELRRHWPDFGLLGEEMDAAEQEALIREPGAGLWVLDPLDGTSNFAAGIPYFSVSLALIRGGEVSDGLVYDPPRDELFQARRGGGTTLNGEPLGEVFETPPLAGCIAAIDLKRLPGDLGTRLATTPPYSSQRSFGSVALDWCWLAAGRFHVYLHGRQKLWDYAAGQLVLAEAGGRACNLEGERVFVPSTEARSAVAALDDGLFQEWRRYLGIPPCAEGAG